MASTSGDSEIVRLLIQSGANPNFRSRDGWTCLMMAARDGDYDVAKELLDGGADVYAGRDMFGRTALDMVNLMQKGQGMQRKQGESFEVARLKDQRLHLLLSRYAASNLSLPEQLFGISAIFLLPPRHNGVRTSMQRRIKYSQEL